MALETEGLLLELRATANRYERELARAHGVTVTQLRRIERSVDTSSRRFESSFARAGSNLKSIISRSIIGPLTGIATALSVRQLAGFLDSATRIENSLKIVGLEGVELQKVMEQLADSARRNGAPFETLASLYSRAALAQKELKVSSQDLLSFVDNVAAALRVAGKSAGESRGALVQLSQAIGGTVVRAEEFNSILEGALPIAQAAARGLEEAGGSVAKLQLLVIDGKVSSEAFFHAFQAGAAETQRQAREAELTIDQSWQNVITTFTESIGAIDKTTGASSVLAEQMRFLAHDVGEVVEAFDGLARLGGQVVDIFQRFGTLSPPPSPMPDVATLRGQIAAWEKLLVEAEARGEHDAAANMRARIRELQAAIRAAEGLIGPAFERLGRHGAEAFARGIKTVSLDDFISGDLVATLDAILKDRRREFSGLTGAGSGSQRLFDVSSATAGFAQFPTSRFDVGRAAEQLQILVRQREEIRTLTADLGKLESALQAHFNTPLADIMGDTTNITAARAEIQRSVAEIEALKAKFLSGSISALEFNRAVKEIRKRLQALGGEGNALDPFISNTLKAISVLGDLRAQLNRAQSAIRQISPGRSTQVFTF